MQGKINRELGKIFEDTVDTICQVYELNGLARIEKTPEPMKILKYIDGGRFEAVFEKSAQPDFKGTVKGGRTVVFDAKFTEADRIRYQALSDHQRETLLKYSELGAMAFILVGFANGKIYKIDINEWLNMKQDFGRLHITQEELDNLNNKEITTRNKNGVVDFLNLI
ncbi:MAG: Holliday junction resolvase RecU [Clostridia bacterium]|nr:Holliday junction resolvase RecU [Clostridia bacterium]